MSKETFIQAGAIVLNTKLQLQELLSGPEFSTISLTTSSTLDQLMNRLHFLGGTTPNVTPSEQFLPITNFMGEEISRKEVTKADIIPEDSEKKIFVDKVESLYDVFNQMHPDKILSSYTLPEDILVLRGVAKLAGVKSPGIKKITVQFIEEIKEGIKAKAKEAEDKARFDAEFAAKNGQLPNDLMTGNQVKNAIILDATGE